MCVIFIYELQIALIITVTLILFIKLVYNLQLLCFVLF